MWKKLIAAALLTLATTLTAIAAEFPAEMRGEWCLTESNGETDFYERGKDCDGKIVVTHNSYGDGLRSCAVVGTLRAIKRKAGPDFYTGRFRCHLDDGSTNVRNLMLSIHYGRLAIMEGTKPPQRRISCDSPPRCRPDPENSSK